MGVTLENATALVAAEITDDAGLAALADEWRSLAAICRTATIFQTYEWNAVWWRTVGKRSGARLAILTFRDPAERLVGIAPLVRSSWYGLPVTRLTFLAMGASDYLDLLAAPGCEGRVVESFYRYLADARGWQAVDLRQLRDGGLLRSNPGPEHGDLNVVEAPQERCPFLLLPDTWDALARGFGKKTRSNIGYYDRALQKSFSVEIGCVRSCDEAEHELARLFALHRKRWNKRWLPGVFVGSRIQGFHRDLAKTLLERGWLRLFYLRLDGVTQASLYCFSFAGRMCYYQAGFEPGLARFSPGTVLTAHAMRIAIDEACTVFDLLRGDEPYKAKWTQAGVCNARRLITRNSNRTAGRLARTLLGAEDYFERKIKAWAQART